MADLLAQPEDEIGYGHARHAIRVRQRTTPPHPLPLDIVYLDVKRKHRTGRRSG
jgi:hypothetical protein